MSEVDIWDSIAMLSTISSTTFFVTLALRLSPFCCSGRKNVLPIKSSWSNSGIAWIIDRSASSCLDLIKTVGTFGICVLEPSEDHIVPDSPPSMSSLWLRFTVVIGLTALLYIIFWICLSNCLCVIASPQCSPNSTQKAAHSALSDGKC